MKPIKTHLPPLESQPNPRRLNPLEMGSINTPTPAELPHSHAFPRLSSLRLQLVRQAIKAVMNLARVLLSSELQRLENTPRQEDGTRFASV